MRLGQTFILEPGGVALFVKVQRDDEYNARLVKPGAIQLEHFEPEDVVYVIGGAQWDEAILSHTKQ